MERLAERPGDMKISKTTFPALEALIVWCDRMIRITTTKDHVLRSGLKMACARALRQSGVSFLKDSEKASQRWWPRRKKQESAKWQGRYKMFQAEVMVWKKNRDPCRLHRLLGTWTRACR